MRLVKVPVLDSPGRFRPEFSLSYAVLPVRRVGTRAGWLGAGLLLVQTAVAEPLSLSLGEGEVFPEISITYVADDNVFAARETMQEASGVQVEPKIRYVADKRDNSLSLSYIGDYLNSEESRVSYADHKIQLDAKGVFTRRSRAEASLSYGARHIEPSGRIARETNDQLTEPFTFNEFLFNSRYWYGAAGARGNIAVGLRARSVEHTNEPDPTQPQRTQGLDFTSVSPYALLSFRVSADTRVFLDLRFGSADYDAFVDPDTPELDHAELRTYIGTSWDLTGRTGGRLQVGLIDIDFDNNRQEDTQITGYELEAYYDLTSYSKLEISASREQDSTTDNTLLGREDIIKLLWSHDWSSRFNSEIGLESTTSFGVCNASERKFTQTDLHTDFSLQVRRWLSFGLGFELTDESADACTEPGSVGTFEQTKVLLGVNITL